VAGAQIEKWRAVGNIAATGDERADVVAVGGGSGEHAPICPAVIFGRLYFRNDETCDSNAARRRAAFSPTQVGHAPASQLSKPHLRSASRMNGDGPSSRTFISPADLHDLKTFWGAIFAAIFLFFVWLFLKSAVRARDIKYNWFGVVLSFLTIGFALYMVFFVQL
jgi:hypothetical protein